MSDHVIDQNVKRVLQYDYRLRDSPIEVDVSMGVIKLSGIVGSYSVRMDAEQLASKTVGAVRVDNQLTVRHDWIPDREIENDISLRLRVHDNPALQSVRIEVDKGIASLTGTVDLLADKNAAETVARSCAGIQDVKNLIRLNSHAQNHSLNDNDIKQNFIDACTRDAHLSGVVMNITVTNGNVTVTGEVANLFVKQMISDRAKRTAGVAAINNQVSVASQLIAVLSSTQLSDDDIAGFVVAELGADPRIHAKGIQVEVVDHAVTLTGLVVTHRERKLVHRLASEVVGVSRVDNQVAVEKSDHADETKRPASEMLRQVLLADSRLGRYDLKVSDDQGVTSVDGVVPSQLSMRRLEEAIKQLASDSVIVNRVKILPQKTVSDSELKEILQARLASNVVTSPMADQVIIRIDQGLVDLSGSVSFLWQKSEIKRLVRRTAGVRSVTDNIKVRADEAVE